MTNDFLVSIIIPTYNRERYIIETLKSVKSQTYSKWECLIIDDGSTDNTFDIVENFINDDCRFQYHKRPENLPPGGNAARNYGFELSSGDFIQWFDDDDVMLPNYLRKKVQVVNSGIDVVIGLGSIADEHLKEANIFPFDSNLTLYKGFVLWRSQLVTGCVLFKKEFLRNTELFNVDILRGQESEFFSRIFFKLNPERYIVIKESLFLYRQHTSTKSEHNKVYDSKFKASEIFVALENLKRGIQLTDKKLIQYFYRVLVNFFFRALESHDIVNSKRILSSLVPILKTLNYSLSKKFSILGRMLILSNLKPYFIEMYFKNYKI